MAKTPQTTIDSINELARQNPTLSNRKIAEILNIGKDTVNKFRKATPVETQPLTLESQREVLKPIEEHSLRRENARLKTLLNEALDDQVRDNVLFDFADQLAEYSEPIPEWVRKTSKGRDIAVPCVMASDWHLDEKVFRSQVGGVNEYNRKIAVARCSQFFDNTATLAKHFIGGIDYRGLYLLLGGDMFSGNIHEELKETNESTLIESILYWVEPITAGINFLADEFGQVHIPCVVGNHGRNSRKPIAKNRAQDNFDWLFYHMLAMQFKNDDRVTWDISPAADCRFTIFDTDFLLTHGDQFRGGSGIAGLLSPLLLGDHRKRKRQNAIKQPYDWMVYGHWHSLVLGVRGLLGNGSLKGYDEYAFVSNFDYEPPQQALWLVQPRVGVTGRWPVHVLGSDEDYS
jgi:hypothetical protein